MEGTEDGLQRAVAQLLDHLGWLWCHVPNGGYRRGREAARLQGAGVKPGVPDVMIFERWANAFSGRSGFGIAIELKTGSGRASPEQHGWLKALTARGWYAVVCRSVDEVQTAIGVCQPLNGRKLAHGGNDDE